VDGERFSFDARVWETTGQSAWFFVSLPEPDADDIDEMYAGRAAGFGSLRVEVTVGNTTWQTSIFPDVKRGTYVLPLKKSVRVAEQLTSGSMARFELTVIAT
jgi:hypothetical protein